jgi:DNA-binding NarL/FixJ family response regulator
MGAGDIRVLLADDQALVRAGLRTIFESAGMDVVGEAGDGAEACRTAVATDPDVVVMDIRMPVLDGLAATRRLVQSGARSRVIVLTTYDLDEYVFDSLAGGASGFLLKHAPPEDLVAGVRVVAAGDAVLAPGATRRLVAEFARRPIRPRPRIDPLTELTPREVEIMQLLARGLSNSEIAEQLFLSANTVRTHVAHVLDKIGARDRVQAIVFAYENGVVVPSDPPVAS